MPQSWALPAVVLSVSHGSFNLTGINSQVLDIKRDYITEIVYVTETVANVVVYVDQDGEPYSTSTEEQSTAATSVEVVTTSDSAPSTVIDAASPSSTAVVFSSAASAPLTSSAPMPSFSLAPEPEPSTVQVKDESSTTAAVISSYTPQPATPVPTTQTPTPELSSPPPAPLSSPAAAPASSQIPQADSQADDRLPIGVTYDPFTGSDTNTRCKTDTEIADEFSRMSSYKAVRIYGMGCNIIPLAVQNAVKNGQVLMGGAYLSNQGDGEDLSTVITTWQDAIKQHADGKWDVLQLFSVENERVNDHDMTASEVVDAIRRGRDQLRGIGYNGPVGAVDTVPATIDNPSICQASDVVMVNCHAFFDPNTVAEDAGTFVKSQIERVKTACKTDRVVVTESGWPHQGDANGKAVPSPDNQAKALASIRSDFTSDVFIFNSFDSLWKSDSASTFNAERYWGVVQ